MSYRVEFGGGAQVQYHSLPENAREALIERAVELADWPWDAAVRPPGDDTRFRETVFGSARASDEYPQGIADDYPGWGIGYEDARWIAWCPAITLHARTATELRAAIERAISPGPDG